MKLTRFAWCTLFTAPIILASFWATSVLAQTSGQQTDGQAPMVNAKVLILAEIPDTLTALNLKYHCESCNSFVEGSSKATYQNLGIDASSTGVIHDQYFEALIRQNIIENYAEGNVTRFHSNGQCSTCGNNHGNANP